MLRCAVAIAGIIALSAISLHLLRHDLTPSESHIHKSQIKEKKQNKDDSEPQSRTSSSTRQGFSCNSNAFDALEWRKIILENVMKALADPNTHLIGVYGLDEEIKDTLLQRVYRRIQRDQLFGIVVRVSVTKYPDVRKIQDDIARHLGFTFNHMSKDERAKELIHGSRMSEKFSLYSVTSPRDLIWVR